MRTSLTTMILSLTLTLAWLGWSPATTLAGAPGICKVSDAAPTCSAGPGQCMAPRQCEQPAGVFAGICDPDRCCPEWSFKADAIGLQRSTTRSQPLFANPIGIAVTPPINANEMDFPVAVGPQLSAIRHDVCGCGWDLEVAYFQFDGFDARTTAPGSSLMITDDRNTGFLVTNGQAQYTSALYSGELNARRCCNEWLTTLAGFRMLELDEHYQATGLGARVPATFNVDTFNHLYGFQLGADAEVYNMGGPLLIDVLCKAGAYANTNSQRSHRVETGVNDQSLAAQGHDVAFLGEVGVVATYALTQRLAFRATAEAAWLQSVALAPEQIGENNFGAGTATVDASGGVFYYGGGAGFEYRF